MTRESKRPRSEHDRACGGERDPEASPFRPLALDDIIRELRAEAQDEERASDPGIRHLPGQRQVHEGVAS